ncbi:Glutathione S-transferase Z1 [Hibiscus syriacus]|uniref:glutathione transferase n=1 Tax=Hibiscus syriacus TaxID=106335 RepID=A0A6A2Y9S2_HIBSY|nr:Glutathione S-transferase Z1 [Hibiscus syriacus]
MVHQHEHEQAQQQNKLKLYSYWRSSCSFRIRVALNLKGLDYEYIPVNLLKGEQFSPEFQKLNPIGYVPVLVDGDVVVSDSFAIFMYLEEKYPQIPLLPSDLAKKALNIQAANIVSSSIQPLQNLAVLKYIEEKVSPEEKVPWAKFHIEKGFGALEKLLKDHAGKYAIGDEVAMDADERISDISLNEFGLIDSFGENCFSFLQLCLIWSKLCLTFANIAFDAFLAPQILAGIQRFNVDMAKFPLLTRLNEAYSELPEFQKAIPENQPDAPSA